MKNHDALFYQIADLTVQVLSDLPFEDQTFDKKFSAFRVDQPGEDTVSIHHHFELLDLYGCDLSRQVYRKEPWAIYQQPDGWLYVGILPEEFAEKIWIMAKFNPDHSLGDIYHPNPDKFKAGGLGALTTFPSDQILLAKLLADRQGCYLHSAGAILNGAGMLFVGHSEAGKTTTTQMLLDASQTPGDDLDSIHTEILCDDRNIVRKWPKGWRVYGSWSHGDISLVSAASAPLTAICFIEQSLENKLVPIDNYNEVTRRLLACLVKPFVTTDWWEKSLDMIAQLAVEVPCYIMHFDKSGAIINALKTMV